MRASMCCGSREACSECACAVYVHRMDLYFDGTVGRREEPLVHIARVNHARDPTKLRRYNALHRTTKDRPASRVAARPAEAGLKVTGRKAEQQLRTQEEMMAGQAAAEAVAAAKKELQRKLEEMAVGALNGRPCARLRAQGL